MAIFLCDWRGFVKNIIIIGAGDLGKEVVWLIEEINRNTPTYVILGFLDDDKAKDGGEFYGYRVLGDISKLEKLSAGNPCYAVIAIQDGTIRKKIVNDHPLFDMWESIIHPSAVIAKTSPLGNGSIAFPNVTVSVNSKLGCFELLYINSSICNDCIIGDYVSLMSGASISERAVIGDECFLGAGSTVYPHKILGKRVRIGVGVTACKDYSDDCKVSGRETKFSLFK